MKTTPSHKSTITCIGSDQEENQGTVDPSVLAQNIFNDPEALDLLRNSILTVRGVLKAQNSNRNIAGALKARHTECDIDAPATKRPRMAGNPSESEEVDNDDMEVEVIENNSGKNYEVNLVDEDEFNQSASHWQVSEELSSFLGMIPKPLFSFERKAICRKYPHPDVDSVYTPILDDYLSSLVPGVKAVDKENKFLQDRLLDTSGPASVLFEHIYGTLAQSKPGDTIRITYEQMSELGTITSNAIRQLGNASALLSQERRKAVLHKINSQGTLASLALEEFPQVGRKLFSEGFEQWIKTCSETAKTLLQPAAVGNRKPQFFQGRIIPFRKSQGNHWGSAFQGSTISAATSSEDPTGVEAGVEEGSTVSHLHLLHPAHKRISTRYEFKFKANNFKSPSSSRTVKTFLPKLGSYKQQPLGFRNSSGLSLAYSQFFYQLCIQRKILGLSIWRSTRC